jgi:apolipoprotein D and lipocalin family protein
MKQIVKYVVSAAALVVAFVGCSSTKHAPLPTVGQVDATKYMGLWYEVARYENRFEKACKGATAHYTLKGDEVEVLNSCYDNNGTLIKDIKGSAKIVKNSNNAKLKVTFFWPFYGDYWIIKLADDYRYAVVGEPSRKYLWILSRTKRLNSEDKGQILDALEGFGYDKSKLFYTTLEGIGSKE